MNWTLLFNPFKKLPSKSLLLLGLVAFIAFSLYSWMNQIIYDGMLDIHLDDQLNPLDYFNANAINIIIVVLLFHAFALIVNSKTRLVDIFATSVIYRIPIYIASLFVKSDAMLSVASKLENLNGSLENLKFSTSELVTMMGISFLSLILMIWSIVLLFFGFKTASNAKLWWHNALFILAVILGETITKILINTIL